jgi:TusA-related sulfurtransferase
MIIFGIFQIFKRVTNILFNNPEIMVESQQEKWIFDAEYDGKEKSCGDLVMALFKFFKTVSPGMRVKVIAHDPAGQEDIIAWCRVTNKTLLKYEPPYFLIEKK